MKDKYTYIIKAITYDGVINTYYETGDNIVIASQKAYPKIDEKIIEIRELS